MIRLIKIPEKMMFNEDGSIKVSAELGIDDLEEYQCEICQMAGKPKPGFEGIASMIVFAASSSIASKTLTQEVAAKMAETAMDVIQLIHEHGSLYDVACYWHNTILRVVPFMSNGITYLFTIGRLKQDYANEVIDGMNLLPYTPGHHYDNTYSVQNGSKLAN